MILWLGLVPPIIKTGFSTSMNAIKVTPQAYPQVILDSVKLTDKTSQHTERSVASVCVCVSSSLEKISKSVLGELDRSTPRYSSVLSEQCQTLLLSCLSLFSSCQETSLKSHMYSFYSQLLYTYMIILMGINY